jgi:hypothetical protein
MTLGSSYNPSSKAGPYQMSTISVSVMTTNFCSEIVTYNIHTVPMEDECVYHCVSFGTFQDWCHNETYNFTTLSYCTLSPVLHATVCPTRYRTLRQAGNRLAGELLLRVATIRLTTDTFLFMYPCSNFVAISSLVLELLKKCRDL